MKINNKRKMPVLERAAPKLNKFPIILIVCEGKNTEPSYFRQFRMATAHVKPVGEGYNSLSLVNRAAQLAQQQKYDRVWCVFDKDDCPDTDFNNAITKAQSKGFGVAYSNQSFEYWLLLHLLDHQGEGMHRNLYNSKINNLLKHFNITYDGNGSKIITERLFDHLLGYDDKYRQKRILLALERAERNYNQYDHSNLAKEESSTTVFMLVKELMIDID